MVVTKWRVVASLAVVLVAGAVVMATRPAAGQHIFTDNPASGLGEYKVLATPEPSTSPDPGPPSDYYGAPTASDYEPATRRTTVYSTPAVTPYATPLATPEVTPLPTVEPTPWPTIKATPVSCGGCPPGYQSPDNNSPKISCAKLYCAD